ncbi:anti-sigma factor family protein [Candidatus Palauibacter sp.]|uniref:anti-sigma factor family protein n=1 Tax=Candidatus Palauibacter sp. TaxID=3101350 RepID=UPI003B51C3A4
MSHHKNPHVDDGALLALLDGELSVEERRRVENHAMGCAVCAARRDELRFAVRRVTSALEVMDVPAAWVEMPEALREAARSAPVPLASARAAREARSGWRIGWMGRRSVAVAAGLTLLLAAGAYAVPGSPVRGWVDDGIETLAAWIAGGPEEPGQAGPSQVSVEPDDGSVRVAVAGGREGLRLTIRLTDGEQASVRARDANFHVEPGVIEVSGAADEILVTLPRGAASGSVMIDDSEVVRLEGGELRRTASADASPVQILLGTDG